MIGAFYRHGILADCESMTWLANELYQWGGIETLNNETYAWKDRVVNSGLELAQKVADRKALDRDVLLVGHSQGGLVCRVAAVALGGTVRPGMNGLFTQEIEKWQKERGFPGVRCGKLAVITIATPNAGAMTLGQMSVLPQTLRKALGWLVEHYVAIHDIRDLTTPELFSEFENWTVDAKYLSISGTAVNRYRRGWVQNFLELMPALRVSIRFDLPNDEFVEDSSTDLRQSLIRPEVDLASYYRHVRTYPGSINLNHSTVRESREVANVILENLDWLFA